MNRALYNTMPCHIMVNRLTHGARAEHASMCIDVL